MTGPGCRLGPFGAPEGGVHRFPRTLGQREKLHRVQGRTHWPTAADRAHMESDRIRARRRRSLRAFGAFVLVALLMLAAGVDW